MKIENNVITILNIEVIFLSKYISSGFDIMAKSTATRNAKSCFTLQ